MLRLMPSSSRSIISTLRVASSALAQRGSRTTLITSHGTYCSRASSTGHRQIQAPITPQTTITYSDNVVVGLGPVGLAAALESCRANQKVTAITNRQSYTRPQVIGVDHDTINYLKSLTGESAIQDLIKQNKLSIIMYRDLPYAYLQLKTLEDLLYGSLLKYQGNNLEIISIDSKQQITTIDDHAPIIRLNTLHNPYQVRDFHFRYYL